MTLRPATPADIEAIRFIEQRPEFRLYIGQWSTEQHRDLMTSADGLYLVAIDEANNVGGFVILKGLTNPNRSVELARLAVSQPGQGIGRRLLEAALQAAFEDHGMHRVWLDVFPGNERAQHVYLDAGFERDGIFRESILVDGIFYSMQLLSMLEDEYRSRTPRLQPTPTAL